MDLERLAKPFLKNITPYKPGKPIEQLQRERGLTVPPAKLASNENPYPPHPKIREALIKAIDDVNRYPESGSPELVDKLAARLGVSRQEIIVGNGTNEIIDLLIRAYVESDENCVFSSLSFAIYKIVSMQCGVKGIEVPIRDYRRGPSIRRRRSYSSAAPTTRREPTPPPRRSTCSSRACRIMCWSCSIRPIWSMSGRRTIPTRWRFAKSGRTSSLFELSPRCTRLRGSVSDTP
jgi:hypothetical protein